MEEKRSLTQRDYQKKYDNKTKMLSIKYVLKDMEEYNELQRYLERTNQSFNGFAKALIRDFLKNGDTNSKFPPAKEDEKMCFDKFYRMGEVFDRLKTVIGDDGEKYNAVLDVYAEWVEDEVTMALEQMTENFEVWVDEELENSISDGRIDISSVKKIKESVEKQMSYEIGQLCCSI